MSIEVDWQSSGFIGGKNPVTQESNRHVQLDTASLTALGLPDDGYQKFATLVWMANPITLSAGNIDLGAEIEIKGADGQVASVDTVKGLKVDATQRINRVSSNGLIAGVVAVSSPASIATITGCISGLGTNILIYDSNTIPSNGAVPLFSFYVDVDDTFSFDYGAYGLPVTNGLVIVSSSTRFALTSTNSPANIMFLLTYW